MVRVWVTYGSLAMSGLLAVSLSPTASAEPRAMTLQLHRDLDQVKHYDTYQRRRLVSEGGFEAVPLNLGMGTHYAWVYAGTPPQRASVITDTGSSILAFPCSGCDGCGHHTDQPFTAGNSSTLTHVSCSAHTFFQCRNCHENEVCQISQSYMEGSSWQATVVEDIVYLGGKTSHSDVGMRDQYGTRFMFGCQEHETGLFITQIADGIMGLANNDKHIVAKLYDERKIPNKLFALCFAPEGGTMSIGEPDISRHKGEISYAKLTKTVTHDFYGVTLKDVKIAGASIGASSASLTSGQYIVDSGTTDSYLPRTMLQQFTQAFKAASGLDYHVSAGTCQGYTLEQIEQLPNVEIVLESEDGGNMTLTVTPDQYLLREDNGMYCSSIFLSESSGGVIGANIMMDRDVIFDQGNHRVGFVEADCNYSDKANEARSSTPETSAPPPKATLGVESSTPPVTTPPKATLGVESTPPPTTTAPPPKATLGVESSPPPTTTAPPPKATLGVESSSPPKATLGVESSTPPPRPTEPAQLSTAPPRPTEPATLTATPLGRSSTPESSSPPLSDDPSETESDAPITTSVTPSPSPTTKGASHPGKHGANTSINDESEDDPHPMVLTIVGTVLAVAFLLTVAFSVRRNKKNKKDHSWSRVNGSEEDDDDDEEELMERGKSRKSKKKKQQLRSDDVSEDDDDSKSEDDDTNLHSARGGRLADRDGGDDDSDSDDEIFDRSAHAHDEHKHDTRTLERL
ncbi:hypothetical protein Poli38472_009092 [Pythium oligandrum]|uniref:Peptidase A1 domain-containing protein n=1 Tax=Pythium oligandrum TaxID=41045 RepID=A0A8K1CLN8_PYTOL|nr:hypothetical protein Poli38472_009092 [Pythium oligandrum]|eukprot:TMW64925.1 hypothetical protein Poli38472_009092 [Pythium oligandrum]